MESTPKRFEDRQAATAWLTRTFRPWLDSLTPAEREAIAAYKLDAFEPINESLRYGFAPSTEEQRLIASLDRALARFRLPEPVIVYRGFVSYSVRQAAVGREIIDFGYFSTSLLRVVAEDIISSEPEEERLIAEVTIPGGAQIGAFVAAPELVRDYGEVEVLLPRESRFRITGRPSPDHIELEVILS
jgi:hypothetical protein